MKKYWKIGFYKPGHELALVRIWWEERDGEEVLFAKTIFELYCPTHKTIIKYIGAGTSFGIIAGLLRSWTGLTNDFQYWITLISGALLFPVFSLWDVPFENSKDDNKELNEGE
jgi:hypothetical protein